MTPTARPAASWPRTGGWRAAVLAAALACGATRAAGAEPAAPRTAPPAKAASAAEAPLRFIGPLNYAMPFAGFEREALTAGIIKDISDALAARIGRRAVYLPAPPKRVPRLLATGEADGVCHIAPHWVDGNFHWTPPLLEHAGVLVGRAESPPVPGLDRLAGEPLGTVQAYRYPEVEQVLGTRFVRDDAPTMTANLRKLGAGRVRYALSEQIMVDYHNRQFPREPLQVLLFTVRHRTHCAFTLARPLPLEALDRAAAEMARDGTLDKILARYR